MPDETQKQYEITFILSPDLREEEIDSFKQDFEKNIENLEGTIKKKGKPEKRNFSYPIKKFQSGYYLIINFLLNPEKLKQLYSALKHEKEILRYFIAAIPSQPSLAKTPGGWKKKTKPKIKKLKEITKEISEEEIKEFKKATEKKEIKEKKGRGIKLEEIDKRLDEILGI